MPRPAHRPPHVPTDKDRLWVRIANAGGIEQADMAMCLGISPPTLRKHYKVELRNGAIEANARVSASVYQMATSGKNVVAAIWWEKTRRGFSEKQRVETTGPDGRPIEQLVTYRWAEAIKEP